MVDKEHSSGRGGKCNKKVNKCNVRWQSFGSPPDHSLAWIGGPTGFLVDSGHRSTLISSPVVYSLEDWAIDESSPLDPALRHGDNLL